MLDFQGGALAFDFAKVTTRLESQALRRLCGRPFILALILSPFLIKKKGHERKCIPKVSVIDSLRIVESGICEEARRSKSIL